MNGMILDSDISKITLLLLLLATRLGTQTFYFYLTQTRREVKNHYLLGPAVQTRDGHALSWRHDSSHVAMSRIK